MFRLAIKLLIALFLIPCTAIYALVLLLTPDERERKMRKSGIAATTSALPTEPLQRPYQDWQPPQRG